jgi:hypothetical protein
MMDRLQSMRAPEQMHWARLAEPRATKALEEAIRQRCRPEKAQGRIAVVRTLGEIVDERDRG